MWIITASAKNRRYGYIYCKISNTASCIWCIIRI